MTSVSTLLGIQWLAKVFFVARQQDVGVDAFETGKFDRIDDRPGAPVRHDARPPLIVLRLPHPSLRNWSTMASAASRPRLAVSA